MSALHIVSTNPATHSALDEREMRQAYERFCADLKRNFPGVQGEYFGQPSFEEFKEVYCYA
jgi:hypothetical protein